MSLSFFVLGITKHPFEQLNMNLIKKWFPKLSKKQSDTRASYSIYVDGTPVPTSSAAGAQLFNYMMLSKIYTSGNMGFVVAERDDTKKFSCGGYETSESSLQNGTAYIDFAIPRTAVDYSTHASFEFTFVGNSTSASECKIDINIYQSDEDLSNPVQIYTQSAYTVSSATEPVTLKIDRSSLLATLSSNTKRLTIQFEFYSKSNKSIKLISGACNFV